MALRHADGTVQLYTPFHAMDFNSLNSNSLVKKLFNREEEARVRLDNSPLHKILENVTSK